uniref:Uncharacterized protein n=1 Tax=Pithovirus LCDPAC02 TaxID=2506601 RepID=A0A481YRI6_9VIRU|nr:MAG: hypothetical protein LCDPAC02_02750 [Pithovirus LCDPAC02]
MNNFFVSIDRKLTKEYEYVNKINIPDLNYLDKIENYLIKLGFRKLQNIKIYFLVCEDLNKEIINFIIQINKYLMYYLTDIQEDIIFNIKMLLKDDLINIKSFYHIINLKSEDVLECESKKELIKYLKQFISEKCCFWLLQDEEEFGYYYYCYVYNKKVRKEFYNIYSSYSPNRYYLYNENCKLIEHF